MNAPNASSPALFSSVRSSKDVTLALFAGALLVAFALHAGAFLPKLSAPEDAQDAPAMAARSNAAARPAAARRPATERGASASAAEPCVSPRG